MEWVAGFERNRWQAWTGIRRLEDNHPENVRDKILSMSEMEVEKIAQHIVNAFEALVSA